MLKPSSVSNKKSVARDKLILSALDHANLKWPRGPFDRHCPVPFTCGKSVSDGLTLIKK
ncbi:hypothetical protein CHELA40_13872 [Chelatococcus asaccharovorans]|nr:hypothetical protein CHELA40_13872 [Chelatococcus asaccharovorans]CAH1675051.1 hypothetical protein CHELA17_61756 [Chelatococcus asaccharovorans]